MTKQYVDISLGEESGRFVTSARMDRENTIVSRALLGG